MICGYEYSPNYKEIIKGVEEILCLFWKGKIAYILLYYSIKKRIILSNALITNILKSKDLYVTRILYNLSKVGFDFLSKNSSYDPQNMESINDLSDIMNKIDKTIEDIFNSNDQFNDKRIEFEKEKKQNKQRIENLKDVF